MTVLPHRLLPPVEDQVLVELEFDRVRAAVAARCQTPVGQALARDLPLQPSTTAVTDLLHLRGQVMDLAADDGWPSLAGIHDVEAPVRHSQVGGVLEPPALLHLASTLATAERLSGWCVARRDRAPLLATRADPLGRYADLVRAVERTFEPSGRIADDASATLGDLRRKAAGLQETLKQRMEQLVNELDDQGYLQDHFHTLREDRYVLPVKASDRWHVAGIVHDTSQTHQTFFIEPQEVVDLGNRLKMATADVQQEEQRILRALSARVASRAPEILEDLRILHDLDVAVAGARLGADLKGSVPRLSPPGDTGPGDMCLYRFRHPGLVLEALEAGRPDATVPNDLRVGRPPVLVVTGPNTGGKTVALKGVGLAALMTRAGLPLPAAPESRVPLYDHVHGVVGDHQSIARHLSSFGAHLLSVREVIRAVREAHAAGRSSLCVIDEVMAGTDPDQGAALAQGVLEALAAEGAHVVVTTHYEKLKALALEGGSAAVFRNASVGLDPDSGMPTYHLGYDAPGASSALDMAARLLLDPAIVDRARALCSEQGRTLDALLKSLAGRQVQLEQERELVVTERGRWERAHAQAREELERVRERERQLKHKAREDLLEEARRVRNQLAEAERQVRAALRRVEEQAAAPAPDPDKARQAAERARAAVKQAEAVEEKVARRQEAEVRRQAKARAFQEPVKPGSRVFVIPLAVEATVVEVGARDALVQAGPLRVRVPPEDLAPPAPKGRDAFAIPPAPVRGHVDPREGPVRRSLDLRGERVDDAMEHLEAFLDQAYGRDPGPLVVVHGHGSGALRQALRESLKLSPYVLSFGPGDDKQGGQGATVIRLKDA
jgi:DNA mismatch repair protein MutS2